MNNFWLVIREQIEYSNVIFRITKYEIKALYEGHRLGIAWEIINPLLQILTFYVIFGIGFRQEREVGDVPFIAWLIIGKAIWFYLNGCIQRASNSVKRKLSMASKMKFPLSILPTITIVSRLNGLFVMIGVGMLIAIFSGLFPTFYWLQIIYYFIAMIVLVFAISLFTSTVAILFLDFDFILSTIMRFMMFTSGVIIPLEPLRGRLGAVMRLSPFFYIISGFRNSLLYGVSMFDRGPETLMFWSFTLLVGIIGAHLHLKYRNRFSDYV